MAERLAPTPVSGGITFASLSAGGAHTCGIDTVGLAYCWGENSSGQPGNGTTINNNTPTRVSGGLTFAFVEAGDKHTCGFTTTGAGFCWGNNSSGQLGNGAQGGFSTAPVAVTGGVFGPASASGNHSCARGFNVFFDTVPFCWGSNTSGQLGDGTTTDSSVPVAGGSGRLTSQVTAGRAHTCSIALGSSLRCWGSNEFGQLGDGTTNSSTGVTVGGQFAEVTAGGNHTCGAQRSGAQGLTTLCWGLGDAGQLGTGVSGPGVFIVTPTQIAGGITLTSLSAGDEHTCGLSEGNAYCWGRGSFGRLGNGSTNDQNTPVRVLDPPYQAPIVR